MAGLGGVTAYTHFTKYSQRCCQGIMLYFLVISGQPSPDSRYSFHGKVLMSAKPQG